MHAPASLIALRVDARICAAWQTQVAAAKQTPGLLPFLIRHRRELLPRFADAYHQLRALPRRVRRRLHRHGGHSLAGLALLLALGAAPALAATITVTTTTPDINAGDGQCSLIEAIVNANNDAATYADCTAGSGADTIVLPASSTHMLTAVNNATYGATGLPVVSSEITIEGNNSTIRRDSGAPNFRIVAVNATGNLTLKDTTVSGGKASGGPPDNQGGGIFNYEGTVTLLNSTLSGNAADFGGGVSNFALFGANAGLTLLNSTLSGNSAASGGGVFNLAYAGANAGLTLTSSTLLGNSAALGGGVYNEAVSAGTSTLTITNSTLSGNSAGFSGGGVFNQAILSSANAE